MESETPKEGKGMRADSFSGPGPLPFLANGAIEALRERVAARQ